MALVDIHHALKKSPKVITCLTENELQTWKDCSCESDLAPMTELNCDGAIQVKLENGTYWTALEYEHSDKKSSAT